MAGISSFVNMLLVATVLAIVVTGVILFYFLKIRKVASKEEKIDYSTFRRVDSSEYMKFDDIVTEDSSNGLDGPGMIVMDDGNTFVAGIDVIGYDFASAAASERQSTMIHSISFYKLVDKKIQMRQSVKNIELTHNIEVHESIEHQMALELLDLQNEYQDILEKAEDNIDEPDIYEMYVKQLDNLKRSISAKKWMIGECKAVLSYMNNLASGEKDSNRVNQIMFSYHYNPDEFTEEQSKEAIYLRALAELNNKAKAYAAAMERCGCTCTRLTCRNLINLMRKHLDPIYGDDIKLEDLFNSSYNALCITSDSLLELEKKRLSDQAYAELLNDLRKKNEESEELLQDDLLDARREERIIRQDIAEAIKKENYDPYAGMMI